MLIHANPGDIFTTAATGFRTGLTGTVGYAITDAATGAPVVARTVSGIVEDPTGDNGDPKYTATPAAPDAGRYVIAWDDTAGGEAFDDLIVDFESAAPGELFATPDDLEASLGITLTEAEETRAEALLADATGIIQEEFNQKIWLVTNDTLTRPAVYGDRFRLPQRPVASVASVTYDGVLLDAGLWRLEGDELVRVGIFPFRGGAYTGYGYGHSFGWGGPRHTMAIVYTHGYNPVPRVVKTTCLEMVVRVWANPGRVAQQTIGDTSTVYSSASQPPRGLALTDVEREKIGDLYRRKQGSIQLR